MVFCRFSLKPIHWIKWPILVGYASMDGLGYHLHLGCHTVWPDVFHHPHMCHGQNMVNDNGGMVIHPILIINTCTVLYAYLYILYIYIYIYITNIYIYICRHILMRTDWWSSPCVYIIRDFTPKKTARWRFSNFASGTGSAGRGSGGGGITKESASESWENSESFRSWMIYGVV